ncbi:hypothetical protein [Clostridium sp.]|uniref:hypothetical protein n=1 Tax=Clostridium sp. TaxID=1506 RepID=UPI003EE988D4
MPIGYGLYEVYDQYGNDITNGLPLDSNLEFKSQVGIATGKNGLLAVRYLKGEDLTLLGTDTITATDTINGVSTSVTLPFIDNSK